MSLEKAIKTVIERGWAKKMKNKSIVTIDQSDPVNQIMVPRGTRLEIEGQHLVVVAQLNAETLIVRRVRWYEKISPMWSFFLAFLIAIDSYSTYCHMRAGELGWAALSYAVTWLMIFEFVRLTIKPLMPARPVHRRGVVKGKTASEDQKRS